MRLLAGKRWLWLSAALIVMMLAWLVFYWNQQYRERIIYVHSDSCGYCASFTPTFEGVIDEFPDLSVERLQIQKASDYAEAKKLGATATPAVFIVRGGDVVAKLEGDVPSKAFRRFLQKNLAGREEG